MIVMRLTRAPSESGSATFVSANKYSEGFVLTIPAGEYEALGYPKEVEFVVSAEKLSVGRDNDVQELA